MDIARTLKELYYKDTPMEKPIISRNTSRMRKHPPEVVDEIRKGEIKMWNPVRIPHLFQANGQPCSKGKDPCLIITKYQGRYAYYCHRCKAQGYIYDADLNTPGDAMKLLEHFKGTERPVVLKLSDVKKIAKCGVKVSQDKRATELEDLPTDFVLMSGRTVPELARTWLIRNRIPLALWQDFRIGYSKKWDRIIIPLYNYVRNHDQKIVCMHLTGWIGRCYKTFTKEERQEKRRPKYIIQKARGEYERLFFTAPREYGFSQYTPVLFVEDVFSAMRINDTMAHETVALLNTHLPYSLVNNYRDNTMIIWLDPDMRPTTIKWLKRYQSLGFKMGYIFSDKDPKELDQYDIRRLINGCVSDISTGVHLIKS